MPKYYSQEFTITTTITFCDDEAGDLHDQAMEALCELLPDEIANNCIIVGSHESLKEVSDDRGTAFKSG